MAGQILAAVPFCRPSLLRPYGAQLRPTVGSQALQSLGSGLPAKLRAAYSRCKAVALGASWGALRPAKLRAAYLRSKQTQPGCDRPTASLRSPTGDGATGRTQRWTSAPSRVRLAKEALDNRLAHACEGLRPLRAHDMVYGTTGRLGLGPAR